MRVYRIEREKYPDTTLKDTGAAYNEGHRWNSLRTYLLYTAESRALAALEIAVHLDLSEDLPTDRHMVEIHIPDEIKILELHVEDLLDGWDAKPPIIATQSIGDECVKMNQAAVLKVPSSILPPESNYLINPHHPDAGRITVISVTRFTFDSRFKQVL